MSRTQDGQVQLSISLDQEVARRLQEQAASRSVSLTDFVEEIVRAAVLKTNLPAEKDISEEKEPRDRSNGDVSRERLPRSVGLGEADFDARDTDV